MMSKERFQKDLGKDNCGAKTIQLRLHFTGTQDFAVGEWN